MIQFTKKEILHLINLIAKHQHNFGTCEVLRGVSKKLKKIYENLGEE